VGEYASADACCNEYESIAQHSNLIIQYEPEHFLHFHPASTAFGFFEEPSASSQALEPGDYPEGQAPEDDYGCQKCFHT